MEHYSNLKPMSISSIPEDLIAKYDLIAKKLAGSRSLLIRMQMENLVKNCQVFYAQHATTMQLTEYSNDDVFRFFGMDVPKVKKNLTKEAG